jgi:phosphopantothenoylcysteine decarboxylase/phosphopantothenate--cysteine ligase
MLDPVRFITNLSTGEMGYAVAKEAARKGFDVTLISGPTALNAPKNVRRVPIETVGELDRALRKHFFRNDVLIMSAAVGDFVPVKRFATKIPRRKTWNVTLRQTPDLVGRLARRRGRRVVIGFSLETSDWIRRSERKRVKKHLDGIVANYYSPRHNPFGKTSVHVALIDGRKSRVYRLASKQTLARRLVQWAIALAGAKHII